MTSTKKRFGRNFFLLDTRFVSPVVIQIHLVLEAKTDDSFSISTSLRRCARESESFLRPFSFVTGSAFIEKFFGRAGALEGSEGFQHPRNETVIESRAFPAKAFPQARCVKCGFIGKGVGRNCTDIPLDISEHKL